jgi:hypothetical protein
MQQFWKDRPKDVYLEPVEFGLRAELPGYQLKANIEDRLNCFIAEAKAYFLSKELVDEQEYLAIPDGPWNLIRAGLNGLLERLDRYCERESIRPLGWRFKVRERRVPVKRVYHMCPHIVRDDMRRHYDWVCVRELDVPRIDFRALHHLRAILDRGKDLQHYDAWRTVSEIDHYLKITGAFR